MKFFVALTVALVSLLPVSSRKFDLTTDLISYWDLDEASGTRADLHGSNDLTDNNTVGAAAGVINNGGDFEDGSSENLSHADNADLSANSTDFSIQAWVKFESTPTFSTIISKANFGGGDTAREYDIYYDDADGFIHVYLQESGVGQQILTSTTTINTSTLYHIVVTWSTTDDIARLYIDSDEEDTVGLAAGLQSTASNFRIGTTDDASDYMDGIVDEVGFWKRSLSSAEVTELYNSGAGLAYPFTGGGGLTDPPTYDATSNGSTNGGSSITFSHVMSSGANGLILVGVSHSGTITSCTFNGDSLTEVSGSPVGTAVRMFYRVAPDTGTHDVVCSFTGAVLAGAGAISFTDVDQSVPLGSWSEATGTGGSPQTATVNASSDTDEIVVDVVGMGSVGSITFTVGTGQTERVNISVGGATSKFGMSTQTGEASTTMSWDGDSGFFDPSWAIGALAVKGVNEEAPTFPAGILNVPIICCDFLRYLR